MKIDKVEKMNSGLFKKLVGIVVCCAVLSVLLPAQSTADPLDPVYTDILVWEALGLVENLPPVRPYPYVVLKAILETVSTCGITVQETRARAHYERIFSAPIHAGAEYTANAKVPAESEVIEQNNISAVCSGDFLMTDLVSIGVDLNVLATDAFRADVLPLFEYPAVDASNDPAVLGSLTGFLDMNMTFAAGNENLYVQGGINRSSFGPFYDSSVVLGPQAFHAGTLSFVYRGNERWNYSQTLLIIGATNNTGGNVSPEKFMTLHSLQYHPFSWLSLGYYENIVYGDRFDPIYFLPVPYMVAQSIGSYDDNLQMGVNFEVTPFSGFVWAGDIFVDDLSVNELAKLDFDTKMKIAAQTGIRYAPSQTIIKLTEAEYTLVAPYMYTHCEYKSDSWVLESLTGINYQNYTNNGMCMGSSLPPNSDRIALSVQMNPFSGFDLSLDFSYVRHANINESIPDEDAIAYLSGITGASVTDGSIFNYADAGQGYLTYAQEHFMFMEQDTIMQVIQTGLDASYTLVLDKIGRLTLSAGWVFEYIKNYGVQDAIFTDTITSPTVADVVAAKEAWKSHLTDVTNNYLTVTARYVF
jgi:hypothetical protein